MAKFMNYELFTLIVFFTITNGSEFNVCRTNIFARRVPLEGTTPKLSSNEVKVGKSQKLSSILFHLQKELTKSVSFCSVYLKVRKSQKKIVVSSNTPKNNDIFLPLGSNQKNKGRLLYVNRG